MKHLRLTDAQLQEIQARITAAKGVAVRENRIEPSSAEEKIAKKYNNVETMVDGIRFHSRREAERYKALKLLERAGEITELRRQVTYELAVNGRKICRYIADFVYETAAGRVVEDSKGYKTETYKLKRKMMKAILGIEVLET